ncbi:two-component system sensor histidine kinase DcuS [Propionigenium maris DSM 9537]|uniref:Two-component system sensor histidine kinase DcuS n=1 Tax=Propionigenium maris DSM 9537 TaxID=1123000 RepID=A0A9W6GKE2_9FUSO|nr:ATP-binding protein [Propionigenium maris]GLI55371.1 two-component system sensor histidine kinase DcuS [Propionigenium maris DSM 9537]
MRGKFEKKVIIWAMLTAFIPLLLSYGIFIYDKISSTDERIKQTLYRMAVNVSKTPFIQKKLSEGRIGGEIQEYAGSLVEQLDDVDIIVVADMRGVKYSHLDEEQIGDVFVNEDKWPVLREGKAYYSTFKGSQGVTTRRFEPIYLDGKQVGFVMIGKYYSELKLLNKRTTAIYLLLFTGVLLITWLLAGIFAKGVKTKMLGLEPEEIARLYREKLVILNNISEGIIALDDLGGIREVNAAYNKLFSGLPPEDFINYVKTHITKREVIPMKEMIVAGRRVFVSIHPLVKESVYLGSVITLNSSDQIDEVAEEITGVHQIIQGMRANIHEFKNRLHVILGLMELERYDMAKKYLIEVKDTEAGDDKKFRGIEDYYIRGMLMGKAGIAKEQRINFRIKEGSLLREKHGIISYNDLITIIGNLIENAFEAFSHSGQQGKVVELHVVEDDKRISISLFDNAQQIPPEIREDIFKRGISSKGEGRGTGLYLVMNRVELYKGSIDIEETSEGKRFCVGLLKGDRND